ncbi:MAG: mechanosensitive ion channel domain-containing protein [Terriglobia bacterium]|jgi:small-conductance mechanosensitive channel
MILCIQAQRSETDGIRGIVDGFAVLIFVWTAYRVIVAARLVQTDWETAAGTNSGAQYREVMAHILINWQAFLLSPGIIAGAIIVGLLAHRITFSVLAKPSLKMSVVDASLVRHSRRPSTLILPLLAVIIAERALPVSFTIKDALAHVVGLGLIASVAWLLVVMIDVGEDVITGRYKVEIADNLAARRIQTQVKVLRRIAQVVVTVVTVAIMLMTFPEIHQIGASLLASAGLAGLVLGVAMRSTLASLIAGIQIALTQPIRIEDAVVVEGEWGWIEEITTTYVVVRIWDLRRLMVPLSYFIEKPFQNWTHRTADLLGSVFIYTDYTVPIEALRRELARILKSTNQWMGKVCVLQVTDAREHTVELRALMDARDSSTAWDLRCYVREKLIEFLQSEYPQCLPKTRAELHRIPEPGRDPGLMRNPQTRNDEPQRLPIK